MREITREKNETTHISFPLILQRHVFPSSLPHLHPGISTTSLKEFWDMLSPATRKVFWDENIASKMAAENDLSRNDLSGFIVEKGAEVEEENDEEITEISLSPDLEAEEARKAELREQARKIEEEIVTLKQALDRKENQLAEIKRLLGITAWSQLREGFNHQYQNLQGTQMYQKTSDTFRDLNDKIVHSQAYNKLSSGASTTKTVLSDAGSRTASAAKNVGSVTAKKLGEIRGSSMFQSLESRVVSASSSLKFKMLGSSNKGHLTTSQPASSPDNDISLS